LKMFVTTLATLIICGIVLVVIFVWNSLFEGNMGLVASICLTIQIQAFRLAYNCFVPVLVDWENHKFQRKYYDSYVFKQFLFQSVNSYAAFFYIAIKQKHTAAGCKGGCLAVLRFQLASTLLILSVARIGQVVFESNFVKIKLWWEHYQLKVHWIKDNEWLFKHVMEVKEPQEHIPKRYHVEEQSKYGVNRYQEQVENMLQLVLALGFVFWFGGVAPIIVPCCLAVYVVQLRASAYMLLCYTQRPLPRTAVGIGSWRSIINFMMQGSVIFAGFLVTVYGDTFRRTPLLTRMAGVFLYVMFIWTCWFFVDKICPGHSDDAQLLWERRKYVVKKIMDQTMGDEGRPHNTPRVHPGTPEQIHRGSSMRTYEALKVFVQEGRWADIPHLEQCIPPPPPARI